VLTVGLRHSFLLLKLRVLLLQILPHAHLQALFLLHALLLFLLLLALFLLDLLLEFALHSKPLCVLFALDHIFLVSPADQDAALLFKFQV